MTKDPRAADAPVQRLQTWPGALASLSLLLQSAPCTFSATHPNTEHATREVTTHITLLLLSSIQKPRLVSSRPPRAGNPHIFHS
jgi:hypothetical protein